MLGVLFVIVWHTLILQQGRIDDLDAQLKKLKPTTPQPEITLLEQQLQSINNKLKNQSKLFDKTVDLETKLIQIEKDTNRLIDTYKPGDRHFERPINPNDF